jgi:predicted hotdog family 3-hydroxylacyl-ACP dehydratase
MNGNASPSPCADIETLIPHRAPMRLAQAIVKIDDESIETASVVQNSWPTACDGHVRTLVLIELVAQTAAVLQGWRERHERTRAAGGLLVGVHEAKLHKAALPIGSQLRCFARISYGAPNYLAFTGRVEDIDGTCWLNAAIQAFRPEEPPQPQGLP